MLAQILAIYLKFVWIFLNFFSDFMTLFASALQNCQSSSLEYLDLSKNVLDDKKGKKISFFHDFSMISDLRLHRSLHSSSQDVYASSPEPF